LISVAGHGDTVRSGQCKWSEVKLEDVIVVHEANNLGDCGLSSIISQPIIAGLAQHKVN
jgi:hypothetical protein